MYDLLHNLINVIHLQNNLLDSCNNFMNRTVQKKKINKETVVINLTDNK